VLSVVGPAVEFLLLLPAFMILMDVLGQGVAGMSRHFDRLDGPLWAALVVSMRRTAAGSVRRRDRALEPAGPGAWSIPGRSQGAELLSESGQDPPIRRGETPESVE
jgi:hypothetical protein